MNTVVVAIIMTTITTEVVEVTFHCYTGIAPHSQWRCSTGGLLFPVAPLQVKHVYVRYERSLLGAVMTTECNILVSCPQEQTLPNNSSAVCTTTKRLIPSLLFCER